MTLGYDMRPALFSQRLQANRCKVCGPGLGRLCRGVPGWKGGTVFVLQMCVACGGQSRAFLEEHADA